MTADTLISADKAEARRWRDRALVRVWLYVVLLFLVAIVLVGGVTRLTDSGLSITEWKPVHGVVPPQNDAEWQQEFDKYRQIPEYRQSNQGMSLDAFKTIFWWEWTHRILARGVGFAFALPFLYFWATGRLERRVIPMLLGIFALGGLQGAIGWWMVASGLTVRTDVSQYRLAVHLTLACLIFAAVMVAARGLAPHSAAPAARGTQRAAGFLLLLVLVQIYLGGLVAGLDAGLSYNTWPLMDGAPVPGGLFAIEPGWRNFFENPKMAQFAHRISAYALFLLALWHAFAAPRSGVHMLHARRAILFFMLITAQAAIGIATLVLVAPLGWAIAHQAVALLVLGFAAAHWRGTKGAYPLEDMANVRPQPYDRADRSSTQRSDSASSAL